MGESEFVAKRYRISAEKFCYRHVRMALGPENKGSQASPKGTEVDYEALGFKDARDFADACKGIMVGVAEANDATGEALTLALQYLPLVCREMPAYLSELLSAVRDVVASDAVVSAFVIALDDNVVNLAKADCGSATHGPRRRFTEEDVTQLLAPSVKGGLETRLRRRVETREWLDWQVLDRFGWVLLGKDADWDDYVGIVRLLPRDGEPPDYLYYDGSRTFSDSSYGLDPLSMKDALDWAVGMCEGAEEFIANRPDDRNVTFMVTTLETFMDSLHDERVSIFPNDVLAVEYDVEEGMEVSVFLARRHLHGYEEEVQAIHRAAKVCLDKDRPMSHLWR